MQNMVKKSPIILINIQRTQDVYFSVKPVSLRVLFHGWEAMKILTSCFISLFDSCIFFSYSNVKISYDFFFLNNGTNLIEKIKRLLYINNFLNYAYCTNELLSYVFAAVITSALKFVRGEIILFNRFISPLTTQN